MLKSIEAVIDVKGEVHLREPLKLKKSMRAIVTILDDEVPDEVITLMSERALAEDWLKPEEEEAWQSLQKGQ